MAAAHVYQYRTADPVLGIRVGTDACKRATAKGHSPRGAIMRLAKDLAVYGQNATRDEAQNLRHARRTAEIKGDGSRVGHRITLECVLAAEAWYASHRKQPSRADMATMIATARDEGTLDKAREAITIAVHDNSDEAERVRATQNRAEARARRLSAKAR